MAHHGSNPFDDGLPEVLRQAFTTPRETAFDVARRLGATGKYPQGKLTEEDEGEIAFAVAADKSQGKIIINFGKPVAWVGMDKQQAIDLAECLIKRAAELG